LGTNETADWLAYYFEGALRLVHVPSGETSVIVPDSRHHEFCGWLEDDVCLLDKTVRTDSALVRLDVETSGTSELARGPLRWASVVSEKEILVQVGERELWLYDLHGNKRRVFSSDQGVNLE
jgi:hypothetical protein